MLTLFLVVVSFISLVFQSFVFTLIVVAEKELLSASLEIRLRV